MVTWIKKSIHVKRDIQLILVHQYQIQWQLLIQWQMFMTVIAIIILNVVGIVLKIAKTLKKNLNYLTLITTTIMTTTITMIMVSMTLG